MKRFLITILLSIVSISATVSLYLFFPTYFQTFDNKVRDIYFLTRGEIDANEDVVIVDIDEKSLKELGQWPWERIKVAQVLNNLTEAGVGIIGLDIVFSERDNSSPKYVAEFIGLEDSPLDEIDYDEILAKTVANTPTLLGYVFQVDESTKSSSEDIFLNIPAIFIEKNLTDDYLITPNKAILNLEILQDSAYSSGFFNALPDDDGIVRSVPLVMKYQNEIYPAISFEMVRIAKDISKVIINYDSVGVESMEFGDVNVPIDRFGRLYVNYRGGERSYKYLSAVDIYNGDFDPKEVEGKFVLIGTSAQGLLDLRTTPFGTRFPGVEIHANVIDNILSEDFLFKPSWVEAADMLFIISIGLITAILLSFTNPISMFFIAIASIGSVFLSTYYLLFEYGFILNVVFPLISSASIIFIANLVSYFLETKQKELIKGKFATKVSPAVMEDLIKKGDTDVFSAQDREVTVFFSDVRGFTNISEAMPSARALIKFLNQYMNPMVDIIVKRDGTIDKFIGDAIMAYWNAPNDVDSHQDKAVESAVEQIRALKPLNEELSKEKLPYVDIGIGLNTGVATVGEMGSTGRSDYTVIGDPINLGARLESLCKGYGAKILISQFTKAGLKKNYLMRDLDLVRVKGKKEPVEIYEVLEFLDQREDFDRAKAQAELDEYFEAVKLYRTSYFSEALKRFKELKEKRDWLTYNIKIYDKYIERCEHYIASPPENFDGVFTFTTKG